MNKIIDVVGHTQFNSHGQSLGLWVRCPFCDEKHHHGGTGPRCPECKHPDDTFRVKGWEYNIVFIEPDGEMPR